MVDYELTLGTHEIVWSKTGYADLNATINVGESAVSCVSVIGGSCGSATPPGVVASGFTVTGYLSELAVGICSWITDKGGWNALTVPNIFELVDQYLGFGGLPFTPTITQIMGCIDYYLGFRDSGNTKTGCSF